MKKKELPAKAEKRPEHTGQYETEIEYICPVRGRVKQKVIVKTYASAEAKLVPDVRPSKSITDQLDVKFSGLILDDSTVDEDDEDDKLV